MATEPERYGTTVIELARDIMAAVAPVTGQRAAGQVLVKSTGGTVYLPRNWPFIAQVNTAAREELLFKVGQGPNRADYSGGKRRKADPSEPDTESWWEVTEAGTPVDVLSIVGGARHNLPAGTKLRFDPVLPSLEPMVEVLDGGIVGGADPGWLGGCQSIVQFETMGAANASLDTFRSATGKFPAAVIVWDGSEPVDGTTNSTVERGASRAGSSSTLYKERFNIFVLTKRLDSDHLRRNEGLKLVDDITFWLTDRMSVDGQVFSSPSGVQIRGRRRIAMNGEAFQHMYLYLIEVSVTGLWRRYDDRTFHDWLLTHNEFLTFEKDDEGEQKLVVSQDIDMTAGSE